MMLEIWKNLDLWFDLYTGISWLFAAVVVAGVLLEPDEEPFPPSIRSTKDTTPLRSRREQRERLSKRLVAIGVAGELLFGIAGFRVAKKIDSRQKERIADAVKEQTMVERLISGNLEIEDSERLRKLVKHAGTPFVVRTTNLETTPSESQRMVFAAQFLARNLRQLQAVAHWRQLSPDAAGPPYPQSGVIIKTWSAADAPSREANSAADALRCFFLLELKIWPKKVGSSSMPEFPTLPREGIYIQVGKFDPIEELGSALREDLVEQYFPDCTRKVNPP